MPSCFVSLNPQIRLEWVNQGHDSLLGLRDRPAMNGAVGDCNAYVYTSAAVVPRHMLDFPLLTAGDLEMTF